LQKYNPGLVEKANITAIILEMQLWGNIIYFFLTTCTHSFDNRSVLEEISLLFEEHEVLALGIQMLNWYIYICTYIMQCGLNLSLFVDQPTISNISTNKVINENDTATITCTVYSIPQSFIRWIFETKELQNKYDGSLTLNKLDCLSMGRLWTCWEVIADMLM